MSKLWTPADAVRELELPEDLKQQQTREHEVAPPEIDRRRCTNPVLTYGLGRMIPVFRWCVWIRTYEKETKSWSGAYKCLYCGRAR